TSPSSRTTWGAPTMMKLLKSRPAEPAPVVVADGVTPIGEVRFRDRVKVAGRVRSVRIQPWAGVATLECTLVDGTGGIAVVFLGRRKVAGVFCGAEMRAEGVVGVHGGRLAILNPDYALHVPPS
ncbi:MAG: OB-fold nucleic acid binding domain-containing protein, partial [Actinobacteria bacterium]|nr:OB-fold nucleic acid binding domain-containing protein [Actinomycetota bacterium]